MNDATEIVERIMGLAGDTIDLLTKEVQQLRTDRDELHATLSGLCSYLGAGTPDDSTTAVEMNRRIHWGFDLHVRLAREKAEKEQDELRRVLERCLMYGQLPIAIADEARKLLEARP